MHKTTRKKRRVTKVTSDEKGSTQTQTLKLHLRNLTYSTYILHKQDREESPEEGDDMTLYTLESDRVQRFRDVTYVTSVAIRANFVSTPCERPAVTLRLIT